MITDYRLKVPIGSIANPKIALWRIRGEEVVRDMQTQCIPRTRQFGSGPEHLSYDEFNGFIACADCETYVPPLLHYYCLSRDKQDLMDELTTVIGNSRVSTPANFLYTDERSPKSCWHFTLTAYIDRELVENDSMWK